MGNFQGGGNRGGGGFRGGASGGGRPSFGGNRGGDRREVTMHKAVCDECNKDCQVPFRPSSDKPIYCNDCFGNKRDDAPRREFSDRGPKKDFGDRGNQSSFSKQASAPVQDDTKNQLREINVKLDRLASAIEKLVTPKAEVKPFVKMEAKKIDVKKPVVAKKASSKKIVSINSTAKKVITKAPVKKVVAKKVISNKKTK